MMGAVFAMQGIGQFGAGIVALICVAGYKDALLTANVKPYYNACEGDCARAVDQIWRIVIGFGAVPASVALYYRLTIPETPRYTFDVARDVEKAAEDTRAYIEGKREGKVDEIRRIETYRQAETGLHQEKASFRDFIRHFSQWKHGKVLLGTAGSWFLLDVAFYGLSLNNSVILAAIGYSGGTSLYNIFFNTAVGNIIIVCAGAIPGYWVTVATVDTVGRKPIQLAGFLILTILFCVIGFDYYGLSSGALLGLYVLCQFFFNFGPNATTFIVPGECFPTRYRSTAHGISAASGKVGSIIAQVAIGTLRTRDQTASNPSGWLNHVMQIYALFMLLGIGTTLLIPETKRKTLEELAGEEPAASASTSYPVTAETESPSGSIEKHGE
jgi:MFS transporter, PHS family, inorganic phosphate transporter